MIRVAPRAALAALLLAGLAAQPASARPGSAERHPLGADRAGLGGAGIGGSGSAWFNPAGLGGDYEHSISASLSAYGYVTERANRFIDFSIGDVRYSGELTTSSVDVFPTSLQYAKPLGHWGPLRHGVGVSVMLPDYDQVSARLDAPAVEGFLLEARVRRVSESKTFWLLPAWGACWEGVCFGAGPALAVHFREEGVIETILSELQPGLILDLASARRYDLLTAAVGAQLGVQVHPHEHLSLGFTARSPVRSVWSYGSLLVTQSSVDMLSGTDSTFIDRVEVEAPRLDYKQPWRLGLGVLWRVPERYELALDVRYAADLDTYAALLGSNGEETLQPSSPSGPVTDPDRAVRVKEAVALQPSVNFNAGGRVHLSDALSASAGVFTDLSAIGAEDAVANTHDQLNRVGFTLGGGWRSDAVTTWVTLAYAYGFGRTVGFGPTLQPELTPLQAHSLHVLIGSSAEL